MHRQPVLVAALALSACAAVAPPQSRPAPFAGAPPSAWSAPASYDLRVSALPVRPAGAAFATAGAEHALVRRDPVLHATSALISPKAVRLPSSKGATGEPDLTARVLEVHAAYQRWCVDASLPEDDVLLASAGGLRLPGAVACDRPATSSRPTRLLPDPG